MKAVEQNVFQEDLKHLLNVRDVLPSLPRHPSKWPRQNSYFVYFIVYTITAILGYFVGRLFWRVIALREDSKGSNSIRDLKK